jgi:hypothetical protein
MSKKDQMTFLSDTEGTLWGEHWHDMPEFTQDDLTPMYSITVHFEDENDLKEFAKLLNQTILPTTRSIWYPEAEIGRMANKRYRHES